MLQNGHPYVEVGRSTPFNIYHSNTGTHMGKVGYTTTLTNWPGMVTGGGNITIKDAGIWLVNARLIWDYAGSGWVQQALYVNASLVRRDVFSYSQFAQSGSNTYGERFINQFGHTETTFMGRLGAGSVVSISAGNYTNRNPLPIENLSLSCYFLRP